MLFSCLLPLLSVFIQQILHMDRLSDSYGNLVSRLGRKALGPAVRKLRQHSVHPCVVEWKNNRTLLLAVRDQLPYSWTKRAEPAILIPQLPWLPDPSLREDVTPSSFPGFFSKDSKGFLVHVAISVDWKTSRRIEEQLRKDRAQAEEHSIMAQTVTQLPLLDRPRDQGREEERLVQRGAVIRDCDERCSPRTGADQLSEPIMILDLNLVQDVHEGFLDEGVEDKHKELPVDLAQEDKKLDQQESRQGEQGRCPL
mmetsp:Transcript_31938/g.101850  ORF Transcript_31938/g.101850 Transcript_31938/m.101850 type:complete len:254 (+) Transcript_31938:193-954(+)